MDGMGQLAEAINRLADSIELLAGKGLLDQTTGARAGQPESAKPFGTPVAIKIKDQDLDQRSESSLSLQEREKILDQENQEIDWTRAIRRTGRLMELLKVPPDPNATKNRQLLLQVVATAQVRLTKDWLDPVERRVAKALRAGKVKSPLGYFVRSLQQQLPKVLGPEETGLPPGEPEPAALSALLREILDSVVPLASIPATVDTELKAGRAAASRQAMDSLPPELRAAVERTVRKLSVTGGELEAAHERHFHRRHSRPQAG